ncbi:hypothetical protein KBI23_19855 [bacterium]|nr:hypothetical protein [bacterium]MBP9809949.1 hypothetical protein [bacterium]
MRHFGDSAQPNTNGVAAADAQLTAVPKSEAGGNLARFIHDQFSPANRYDLNVPSPYEGASASNAWGNGWGAGERARQQSQEAKTRVDSAGLVDAATLPALTFEPTQRQNLRQSERPTQYKNERPQQLPEQWDASEKPKFAEPKALGNLFSPAPDKNSFLTGASERSKEAFAASVMEDFRSPFKSMHKLSAPSDETKAEKIAARDVAFEAANCYQTIQINPQEGSTKTITTLSDLSSSRIHIKSQDGSSTTYTDRLGRPISESRFDVSGTLVSETTSLFDTNAAIPTKKIIRTANETTEISLDSRGMVIAKTTLPYSDLNNG